MPTGQKIIWKFQSGETSQETDEQGFSSTNKTGYGPAPQLVPASGNFTSPPKGGMNTKKTPIGTFTDINVVRDYPWVYSSATARDTVPRLILKEERILQNPTFNALAYNMFTATDMLEEKRAKQAKESDESSGGLSWVGGGMKFLTSGMSQETKENLSQFTSSVKKMVKDIAVDSTEGEYDGVDFGTEQYRRHLEPYQRLYSTFPTGFRYHLPYLEDGLKQAAPGFTDSASGQSQLPLQKLIAQGTSLAASVVNSLNAAKPGTYVEMPKYPNFPAGTKSYNISIPLLNTVSVEDTYRNWQLLFLLIYQNLPNRVNRSVILPPKIYEARIPGVWYSRYAYISDISVSMLGARREMRFENTSDLNGGMDSINTIVPDAYKLDLTVTELISESQNYMFESIMRDAKVTISEKGTTSVSSSLSRVPSRDSINAQSNINGVVSSGARLGRDLLGL